MKNRKDNPKIPIWEWVKLASRIARIRRAMEITSIEEALAFVLKKSLEDRKYEDALVKYAESMRWQ